MAYIELAWRRDASSITHIDEKVQDFLGYTAEEVKMLFQSAAALTPWVRENFKDLLHGLPDSIASCTYTPYKLRHKDGHAVTCQITAICRYDEHGNLADLFGMVRPYPAQEELHRFLDQWLVADDAQRQAVCGLMDLLAAR